MMDQVERTHNLGRLLTVILLVTAALTILLATLVAVAWLYKPKPITMEITGPAGEEVICHLVIDGRADVRRGIAPVTFSIVGEQIEFAVIPVSANAGKLRLKITSSHAQGSTVGDGLRGTISNRGVAGGMTLGALPPAHIDSMRAAVVQDSNPPEMSESPRQ